MQKEDLRAYVNELGVDVIIKYDDGVELPIKAIFDDAFFNTQLGEIEIDTSKPRITCVWEDIINLEKEDMAVVNGIEYYVLKNPQPDGTGMGLVILSKAND